MWGGRDPWKEHHNSGNPGPVHQECDNNPLDFVKCLLLICSNQIDLGESLKSCGSKFPGGCC